MNDLSNSELEIANALLSHASDDYLGLWELVPIARSISLLPEEKLLAATKAVALKLWNDGVLDFIWGEPDPDPRQVLTETEIRAALDDPNEWSGDRPYRGRMIWISSRTI